MTKMLFQHNHLLLRAAYRTPQPHSHLASHLIVSLKGTLNVCIGSEKFQAMGICIAPDALHTVYAEKGEILLFLFVRTSSYAKELDEKYLNGNTYRVMSEELVRKLRTLWYRYNDDFEKLDAEVLRACGMKAVDYVIYEERVQRVLDILNNMETIGQDVMNILCGEVHLSQSRLSHLFKEQTGISLRRYLVLEKMRKGYCYAEETGSITEASLRAGFDSASHYAATCKRMFGICFTELEKSKRY